MESIAEINADIHRITLPYKDISTSVCTVRTERGVLLFDTGSYDEDIERYILPFLGALGITEDRLTHVFVSHGHTDHAGGLKEFARCFPKTRIVTRSKTVLEEFEGCDVLVPEDGDRLLDTLRVVALPGHTKDCSAVLDERTGTLISGDGLQFYGIYGSGNWGTNISHPRAYFDVISRLRGMGLRQIVAAHDYHPYGYRYVGEKAISDALDACMRPIEEIARLIADGPSADDEEICRRYGASGNPPLRARVAAAVRAMREGET